MKGSYILLIEVKKNSRIRVGSLGRIPFKKGLYAYVGSAMNNLEARINRHLRKNKRTHWHVDYLLKNPNVKIRQIFYRESKKKEECEIVKKVSQCGEPIKGFGCSDCKCKSHLFKLRTDKFVKNLKMINFK